jgi:hypothetical protein
MDKCFPPGWTFNLIFHRTPRNFYIVTKEDSSEVEFYVKIHDISITVPFLTVETKFYEETMKKLTQTPALYFFEKVVPYTMQFQKGATELQYLNVTSGLMPKAVYVFLLKTKNYIGTLDCSPFVMEDCDAREIGLYVNRRLFPRSAIPWDKTSDNTTAYSIFQRNIGISDAFGHGMISLSDYNGDYTMFVWDLSPDNCNNYHLHEPRQGTIDIIFKLNTALEESVTMFVFAAFNKVLELEYQQEAVVKPV